jgi:hypothetical protein
MSYHVQSTNKKVGDASPALDHNLMGRTLNKLNARMQPTENIETLINRWDFDVIDSWLAANGTYSLGGGFMTLSQSSSALVRSTITQTVTSGTLYSLKASISGTVGKFMQVGVASGSGFIQWSQPVKMTAAYQEVSAMVNASGTSITLYIQGYDTVAGENIVIDWAELASVPTPVMSVIGRTISKNGAPKRWRGMNHSNTPIGFGPGTGNETVWGREPKQSRYDLADIKAMGCDAIKLYGDPYDRQEYGAMFDECYRLGLDIFMIYYSAHNTDYSAGNANRTTAINGYVAMVNNVKYHPAVVAYGFGNEQNYELGATSLADWYSLVGEASTAAKAADATRVTFTANGDLGNIATYDSSLTSLDFWGANVYQGLSFQGFDQKLRQATTKPFIFTEFGFDSYNQSVPAEDEPGQALRDLLNTKEIEGMRSVSGSFLFEWADEWWKESQPGDLPTVQDHVGNGLNYNDDRDQSYEEEYFGITKALNTGSAQSRVKKQTYFALQNYYLSTPADHHISTLEFIHDVVSQPGGFMMKDDFAVDYRVKMSTRGILTVVPIYVLQADSATTPILKLDGAHVKTTVVGADTLVDTWVDQSLSRKNPIQYNPSNKPKIITGANGLPALRFAGTGQFMDLENFPYGNNVSVFVVAANQRTTIGSGDALDTILSGAKSGGKDGGVVMLSYNSFASTTTRALSSDYAGSYDTTNAAVVNLYVNGSTTLTLSLGTYAVMSYIGTNVTAKNFTRFGMFTDAQWNGQNDIAEVQIYQGAMTNTQRIAVENSLKSKYAIT